MREYLSPLLWTFLPPQLAGLLLPILSSVVPFILPPAPRGSPRYVHNYRLVLSALVLGWLAYAFVTDRADDEGGDYYAMLGVGTGAGDDELKKAYRGLSRIYHPDRVGANAGPEVEARFIAIRQAYEALTDPVKRYAYDRFGPDVARWQDVKTTRDYMIAGAQSTAGFYLFSFGIMLVLGLLGKARAGAYWRHVLAGVLLTAETYLLLAPTPALGSPPSASPLLAPFPRPVLRVLAPVLRLLPAAAFTRPTYQYIRLLRRLMTDAGVAISQLADTWTDEKYGAREAAIELAGQINKEAGMCLTEELSVLRASNDPEGAERTLLGIMEEEILERGMRSHPAVGPAYERAMMAEVSKFFPPQAEHTSTPAAAAPGTTPNPAEMLSSSFIQDPGYNMAGFGLGGFASSSMPVHLDEKEMLEIGREVPLPPSRPETPVEEGPRRRSARLRL